MSPPDRNSGSGVEMVLEALRSDLSGYKESVDQGFRDMRGDLKEHIRDEKVWQDKIEVELLKMTGIPARFETVERKVGEHDQTFQQVKGATTAGKVMWAGIGMMAAGVAWLASHTLTVQPRVAEQHPTYIQVPTMPEYAAISTPSASASVAVPAPHK